MEVSTSACGLPDHASNSAQSHLSTSTIRPAVPSEIISSGSSLSTLHSDSNYGNQKSKQKNKALEFGGGNSIGGDGDDVKVYTQGRGNGQRGDGSVIHGGDGGSTVAKEKEKAIGYEEVEDDGKAKRPMDMAKRGGRGRGGKGHRGFPVGGRARGQASNRLSPQTSSLANDSGFGGCCVVGKVGHSSSGLAMRWKSHLVVKPLGFSQGHIDVEVQLNEEAIRVTGFYGNPETHLRQFSWELLR